MKPIDLTIVIPTCNRGELLRQNIASLLRCNYDFELLVFDDGSTDNTEEVVKAFGDRRITYVKHFSRHGYARSMNEGIECAKNSWVLLFEDDVFIVDPDVFFETLLGERGYKRIIATRLLLRGKEVKLGFLGKLKRFFAEPLAGEIYLYNGDKRKVVRFCNACCSFNKEEIRTRFDESGYFGNAFRIESDFQIRARKEGATIIYNPKLLVDHRRYPMGGHRVQDRDNFLYQCMVNHIIFLKKHCCFWNVYVYVLLKLLTNPTRWFLIKGVIKKYVNLVQNALIDY